MESGTRNAERGTDLPNQRNANIQQSIDNDLFFDL